MWTPRRIQAVHLLVGLTLVVGGARAFYVDDFRRPGFFADAQHSVLPELRRLDEELRTPAQQAALIAQNPEWLLMANTFLAYAWFSSSRADPARTREAIDALDGILHALLARSADAYFLPYHRRAAWKLARGTDESIFYLGEIALVLGFRRALSDENPAWRARHRAMIASIAQLLGRSPNGYAESYPDEAWTFCNVIALAALLQSDTLEGTDHRPLVEHWRRGMQPLVDARTGILASAYTLDGHVSQRAEGSSIWCVITFLSLVDEELAQQQYAAAVRWLGGETLGFAWAREWPAGEDAIHDVDSGITVLGIAPASTGFSLAAAHAVGDTERYARTRAFLDLVAIPTTERDGAAHYLPSNIMGDVVFAFAAAGVP